MSHTLSFPREVSMLRLGLGFAFGALVVCALSTPASSQPLLIPEVLKASNQHPELEQARRKVAKARAKALKADGNFDTKIKADAKLTPIGKDTYEIIDLKILQPTRFAGLSVFGGWSFGSSDTPIYYGDYITPDAGEFNVGFALPILRNRAIDSPRLEVIQTELGIQISQAGLRAKTLAFRMKAVDAYLEWVIAGQKLRITQRLLTLAQQRDAALERLEERGLLAPVERIDNSRIILTRRRETLAAEQKIQEKALKLAFYISSPDQPAWGDTSKRLPTLFEPPPNVALAPTLQDDLDLAQSNRPEFGILKLERERLDIETQFAENRLLPKLDLEVKASQGFIDSKKDKVLGPTELKAYISFELPIQQRKARGELEGVEASRGELDARQALLGQTIETELRTARVVLQNSLKRLELAQEEFKLAQLVERAERKRLEAGASDLVKMAFREEKTAKVEKDMLDATRDVWRAWLVYRMIRGSLLDDF